MFAQKQRSLRRWILLVGCSALWCMTGCEEEKPAASEDPLADVDLKGGERHEPPVKPEQIEEGHWYCDMGTVHYSRADHGDGKCALCKMDLVQKKASAPAE